MSPENFLGLLYTCRKIIENAHEMRKMKNVQRSISRHSFRILYILFHLLHFTLGSAFVRKVKDETRNLNEIQKVYSECFVFGVVYRKNTRKIPAQYEIQKVYGRPYKCDTSAAWSE